MGVDIRMRILTNSGDILFDDIYDGRNYEWFSNLQGDGDDPEYEILLSQYAEDGNRVEELIKQNPQLAEEWDYGNTAITVTKFVKWFEKYSPMIHAGWTTKYDAWLYHVKGIMPQLDKYLPEEAREIDFEFISVQDDHDLSLWLYNFIFEHKLTGDNIIFYNFNR